MAGVPAGLPAGVRLSDHISLGVLTQAVPAAVIDGVLTETDRHSQRDRKNHGFRMTLTSRPQHFGLDPDRTIEHSL